MQESLDKIRDQLWDNLRPHFSKYAKEDGQVSNNCLEEMLMGIFDDSSKQDIDYVVKNMHRLDVDGSGSVSFPEFANFLFKMHTGEMSLQKRHIKGKMVRGSERLVNQAEFSILLNEAIKFLNVVIPNEILVVIFQNTDKDKDGHITYVEYFQAIAKYICKSKAILESEKSSPVKKEAPVAVVEVVVQKPVVIVEKPKDWKRSLLREFIWEALRKLYFHYCLGRQLSYSELRVLVLSIYGELDEHEVTFILAGLYELEGTYIEFISFAVRFIYLIAEMGLARFSRNHASTMRTLTLEQFLVLFKNTYKFLSLYQISNKFLEVVYQSIRLGKTVITFSDYLEWIREFLAAEYWYGTRYCFIEDDPDRDNFYSFFYTQLERPTVRPSTTKVGKQELIKFDFSDFSLAYKVRERVMTLLIVYDRDKDEEFSEEEIREALLDLLKESKIELEYVTKNVFRYDRDGDKRVTYDELTNFAVEQHFGEMAIQRLHRKKFYSRGSERIMNKDEFGQTLNKALAFIQIEATQKEIDILFDEIDLDHDGWISYEVYFYFLKYYFGTLSEAYLKPRFEAKKPLTFREMLMKSLEGLNYFERFIKLLFEQLRFIFLQYDQNKNLVFEPNEIEAILLNVFSFSQREVQYIMLEIFRIDARFHESISFDDLCAIILDIYFVNIWLMRRYDDFGKVGWKNRKINCQEFIILITEACYFVSIKPFEEDLKLIFVDLDTDKDGFITISQYIDFIRKYIGRGLGIEDLPASPKKEAKVVSEPVKESKGLEVDFVQAIWGELKRLFDLYDHDHKGYLVEEEFKDFAVEVLNEKSENDLRYIFWNLFRLDEDVDMKIQFEEFAPYVLKHAGEIALQRFHLQQQNGKNKLSEDELFIVISNAYSFLKTMPKSRPVIEVVFKRIGKDGAVPYGNFLSWVSLAIARQFR